MSEETYCKAQLIAAAAYTVLCAWLVVFLPDGGWPVYLMGAFIGAGATAYWSWAIEEDRK